ncbi:MULTISPECIES: hypothetical protein [unclassified Butyrivibrio]|uniref:hypothetical protein n=1 Tax=unclassified Butyrivibrio TaxID=2639466 RepID=UPI0003FC578D|nr:MULTISPECIES: hypothetical protein [unclassified Butyrivibrio]
MAVVFTLLSMLMTCACDLFEKKSVSSKTEEVIKTLVWYGIFNALLLVAVLLFGLDETSLLPHQLILKKPIIIISPILNYVCLFFALVAYKYVGVSVRNSFVNIDGIFFVILLVMYHLITGNADFATRLFKPLTIIGLILVFSAGMIYPHLKGPVEEGRNKDSESEEKSRGILILGIIIAVIAAFFDGSESMVTSVLIGDEIVDSLDYIAVASLLQVIFTFFLWIYLWIKNKKPHNPFRKSEKNRFLGEFCLLASDLFYVFALSRDALLGIILWNAFPVLDIVGARIFMKEKLSCIQYLVLGMLIVGAVFVGLS